MSSGRGILFVVAQRTFSKMFIVITLITSFSSMSEGILATICLSIGGKTKPVQLKLFCVVEFSIYDAFY